MHILIEIKGWGTIQRLFNWNYEEGINFHNEIGEWFADAINEKLEKERIGEN